MECNNLCENYVYKETCEHCKKNYEVSSIFYIAKRSACDHYVTGYLVKNKEGKVKGILNKDTDFLELAYVEEATIMKKEDMDYLKQYITITDKVRKHIARHLKNYNITGEICAWYENWEDFCSDWCNGLGYTRTEARKILHGGKDEFTTLPDGLGIIRFAM